MALSDDNPNPSGNSSGLSSARRGYHAQSHGIALDYHEEISGLEDVLSELPHLPAHDMWSDELQHMPPGSKDLAWQNCRQSVEKYDKDICQAHREHIDTLLVFAGLFSAVVTAFSVESYQWLQDDIDEVLLRDMLAILSQNSNVTTLASSSTGNHLSDAAAVRINICWFLSLSLSLAAALVGILCKQWLREYERDAGQSPEMALAVRHVRFRGLQYWKVGAIVTSMPIMLQIALAFFLIGVVDLLWRLHAAVAGCVTAVAGIALAFYLITTFSPAIQYAYICFRCCGDPLRTGDYPILTAFTEPQCAYKSAQAWIALRIVQPIIDYCFRMYSVGFTLHDQPRYHALVLRQAESWITFDINWVKRYEHVNPRAAFAFETLSWMARHLGDTQSSSWIWHCIWAHWLQHHDNPDDNEEAAIDIECIARAYPHLAGLDLTVPAIIRAHTLIFQCSLRPEISINTTLEVMLRVAPTIGAHSQWTLDALMAVDTVYYKASIRLSDDVAIGLFQLAELCTDAVIQGHMPVYTGSRRSATSTFIEIGRLILRGSPLRTQLLPAMCALALRWLRVLSPHSVEALIRRTAFLMIEHFAIAGVAPDQLHDFPGVVFPARLCCAIAHIWPDYRTTYQIYPGSRQALLSTLLEIGDAYAVRSGGNALEELSPCTLPGDEPRYPPVEGCARRLVDGAARSEAEVNHAASPVTK